MSPKYILCVGDDLTTGTYNVGCKFHPYTIELQTLLGQRGIVMNSGQSGDSTLDMLTRLSVRANLKKFDLVCILGGTNDLFYHDANVIFGNLFQMHELCHRAGVKTVAIGIPEMLGESQYPIIRERRLQVNELLQTLLCKEFNCIYFDLPTIIPLSTLNEEQQQYYWNDDIHLTPAGYNRFGESLYRFIVSNKLLNITRY
jgi:lysophospholipase L1-like esterase